MRARLFLTSVLLILCCCAAAQPFGDPQVNSGKVEGPIIPPPIVVPANPFVKLPELNWPPLESGLLRGIGGGLPGSSKLSPEEAFSRAQVYYQEGEILQARRYFQISLGNSDKEKGRSNWNSNALRLVRKLDRRILKNARQHSQNQEWMIAHAELWTLLMGLAEPSVYTEAVELIRQAETQIFVEAKKAMQRGTWEVAAQGFFAVRFSPNPFKERKAEAGSLLATVMLNWGKELYRQGYWEESLSRLSNVYEISEARSDERKESARFQTLALSGWGTEAYNKGDLTKAREAYEMLDFFSDGHTEVGKVAKLNLSRINNLEEARLLPKGTMIVDVLSPVDEKPLQIHLCSPESGVDTVIPVRSPEELARTREWAPSVEKLGRIDRVVLTAAASAVFTRGTEVSSLFTGKVIWRDPDLKETTSNLVAFAQQRIALDDFAALMLFPVNSIQAERTGLAWSDGELSAALGAAQLFLQGSGIKDIPTEPLNQGGIGGWWAGFRKQVNVRELVLQSLQQKHGIVILFAHGDREKLFLADGAAIQATEIEKLELKHNRPLVLLFSCEGGKSGQRSETSLSFADALKKAGASAVWSFEEKVDVREAVGTAINFLDRVRAGNTLLDAIQSTVLELQRRKGPPVRLKAESKIGKKAGDLMPG